MEKGGRYSLNVIGAGGIGSWLMHALVRPARRFADANKAHLHIRIYDSDKVDESNVHHQNFTPTDVGVKKVEALFEQLSGFNGGNLTLEACPWDVRTEDDFQTADLTIVAIDSPDCRALVASSSKAGKWAICTCAGDSFLFLTEDSADSAISMVTQPNQGAASCQLPGAISGGRIEAGNISVAAVAQTWVLRSLRYFSGEVNAKVPISRAESTILGTLGSMECDSEVLG